MFLCSLKHAARAVNSRWYSVAKSLVLGTYINQIYHVPVQLGSAIIESLADTIFIYIEGFYKFLDCE